MFHVHQDSELAIFLLGCDDTQAHRCGHASARRIGRLIQV